jgi:hypothetical protein
MGKPYKRGVCERCQKESYVQEHHIVPKKVKEKNNKDTVVLCLDCHIFIHELLPDEPQEEDFYRFFTQKWLTGLAIVLLMIVALFQIF